MPTLQATNRQSGESHHAGSVMRIVGFFFGFLLLSPAVLGYGAGGQAASDPQPARDAVTSPSPSPPSNSAADQSPQGNAQDTQTAAVAKEDHGSDRDHKLRVKLGTVSVGAGYTYFSGPADYPYGPYGFYPYNWAYSLSLWYPLWSPYPTLYAPAYFAYGNGKGEVKLAAEPKTAEVYLDSAYAGTADRLKSMWLDPGAYDLSVSAKGRDAFHQRIYVLSGKSLRITAKLVPEEAKKKP